MNESLMIFSINKHTCLKEFKVLILTIIFKGDIEEISGREDT